MPIKSKVSIQALHKTQDRHRIAFELNYKKKQKSLQIILAPPPLNSLAKNIVYFSRRKKVTNSIRGGVRLTIEHFYKGSSPKYILN